MERNQAALRDVFNCAFEAIEFIQEMSFDQFLADRRTQLAVLHLITLIGEATRRTDVAFRMSHAELPWPQMMGMRNKLVHEYDDVDLPRVWSTVQEDLPVLIKQLEPFIIA